MKIIEQEKFIDMKLEILIDQDELIFEEKSEAFTVSIGLSSDEKYYFINTSDHNTSEQYYFGVDEINTKPKLIMKREKGIIYSVSSWDGKFYNHTNKDAEDFKIDVSDSLEKSRIGKLLFRQEMRF